MVSSASTDTQLRLFCQVLGTNSAYLAGKHYTGLCGKSKVHAKHSPVFHNYSSCLSKGQTVHRRCRSNALSSNWHLTLYFSSYALSIWYIFIWHVHKKIKRHCCEPPIFCCLRNTLREETETNLKTKSKDLDHVHP